VGPEALEKVEEGRGSKSIYLGTFNDEQPAFRAQDLAALKYWRTQELSSTSLSIITPKKWTKCNQWISREEHLASPRRKSSGFLRGLIKYRGIAKHCSSGSMEAQ
jgi:AP2-like factor (ANT lineage)